MIFQQFGHGGGIITRKRHATTYAIAIAMCVVFSLTPLAGAAENQNLVNNDLKSIDSTNAITNQNLLGVSDVEIAKLQNWLKEKKMNISTNDELKIGATGEEVKELQQWLKENEFYSGEINGQFDADTENAVKKFQKTMGLKEDGSVGFYTLQAMQQWDNYAKNLNSGATTNIQITYTTEVTGSKQAILSYLHTKSSRTYSTGVKRSYSSGRGTGDCWTNSEIMYSQLTRSGQKARIIQYSTSLSPRHRSVQVYKNGRWVNANYSGYGYRYQPTKNSVNGVVIK